jgi:hypothetical protein
VIRADKVTPHPGVLIASKAQLIAVFELLLRLLQACAPDSGLYSFDVWRAVAKIGFIQIDVDPKTFQRLVHRTGSRTPAENHQPATLVTRTAAAFPEQPHPLQHWIRRRIDFA